MVGRVTVGCGVIVAWGVTVAGGMTVGRWGDGGFVIAVSIHHPRTVTVAVASHPGHAGNIVRDAVAGTGSGIHQGPIRGTCRWSPGRFPGFIMPHPG